MVHPTHHADVSQIFVADSQAWSALAGSVTRRPNPGLTHRVTDPVMADVRVHFVPWSPTRCKLVHDLALHKNLGRNTLHVTCLPSCPICDTVCPPPRVVPDLYPTSLLILNQPKRKNNVQISSPAPVEAYENWRAIVAHYQKPEIRKSIWQIVNSYGGLLLGWIAMYFSLSVGYWLTLLLAVPTAGFVVRIFIIQHDCGHGSFFKSRKANDSVGIVSSLFTMTAYRYWRKNHAIHHAHHAELEERGIGDVWTLTVEEYISSPWIKRAIYRVFRNPFFLFVIAPGFNFVVLQRLPIGGGELRPGERRSVWWTNLALAGLFAAATALIGLKAVLLIELPVIMIAASAGTWLFYVQHQFERTYWEHTPHWNYTLAAMHGSSYYHLPKVIQWFTGNIGFHHIHHLSPRIPNYRLQECHEENPMFQQVSILTIRSSLRTMSLTLWDEKNQRLVTFREALAGRKGVATPA